MKRKLKIYSTALVLLGALFYIIFFSEDSLFYIYYLTQKEQILQQEVFQLRQETIRLLNEVNSIKNDNFYLEKIAREELGLVKDDEVVIIFSGEG